ncbi:MAG: cytochrome c3 family protein, partial [Geobacteraceae bacterium]|nr:cytochrome c3 family protein [Geobacteraceae bacterium]
MIKSVYHVGKYSLSALAAFVLFADAGSAVAKECVDCHSGINDKGSDIAGQMRTRSHHVQGVKLTGRHCYACHWEATSDGKIDKRYHDAARQKKSSSAKQAKVDLVIWAEGVRPVEYKQNVTAVTFNDKLIGTRSERSEVAKVSTHCLSCHNDSNNDVRPFEGDNNTPRQYAWDLQSVASRYSQQGVTAWGKYSTASTNKKNRITKAFSAHGNAAGNLGGWSPDNGYDGDIPVTRGGAGAKNVECFDCHNSHGSKTAGITSSYRTYDGSFNGGILKETVSGKGGYISNYKPSSNNDKKSKNPYSAGAGLCFDCHENAKPGTTPWGFQSTFGAGQPVIGYKDTLQFAAGVKGSTSRYANRQSRSDIASSHLKAGSFLNYSASGKINGLCTPCHDPHGVSRTLGDNMQYAVPLLKGTWLTSPYREDGPPAGVKSKGEAAPVRKTDYNASNREANANFGKGDSGAPRKSDYNTSNRDGNANFGRGDS